MFWCKGEELYTFWLGGDVRGRLLFGTGSRYRLFTLFGIEGVYLHFLPFLSEPGSYKCIVFSPLIRMTCSPLVLLLVHGTFTIIFQLTIDKRVNVW